MIPTPQKSTLFPYTTLFRSILTDSRDGPVEAMKFKRKGGSIMKDLEIKPYIRVRNLTDDNGQDLIEYALVVALIAFAATAGMSTLATKLNQAFANIGSTLTT